MKVYKIQKRVALAASLLACLAFVGASYAQQDKTQEKIRLMVTAVQARDGGDLKASKQALEELVKLAPNDEGVQKMLSDVNGDIERQGKGEAPKLVSAEAGQQIAAQQEAVKVAAEEKAAAEAKAAEEAKVAAETKAAEEAKVAEDAKVAAEEAKAAEAKPAMEEVVAEETVTVTPVDAATAEAVRKQQLSIIAAYDLMDEAYDLMEAGKWDEAAAKLTLAGNKLPADDFSPMSDDARSELKRAKATMAKERAKIAMAERNLEAAKTFANDYATSEENAEKGQAFVDAVEKFEDNPYNHVIADTNPDYAIRQKKVSTLLEKGRRQYLYGDYQGARSTFRQIETIDADNIQAKAYQRLISEKLQDSGRLTYLATREGLLSEVDKAWQRPQVYTGTTADMGAGKVDTVIDAKLREIIIPNISFPDPGVPLSQAINTLSVLSVDYDKATDGKKGVNMVLFDGGAENKNVTLTLRDLSLGRILDLLTQQAGYQYDIENDTVVIRKASNSTATMDTIDFPITSATVTRMIGFKAAGGAAGSDDPFGGGGAAGGGENKEEPIKQFLIKAGVEFGPGATLAFDGTKLWVTNTRRNLDKVRNILLRYNEVKQVEIEAKFMEVNQGVLKELGFNWNIQKGNNVLFSTYATNNSGVTNYNNRPLSRSLTSTTAGGSPITIYTPPDSPYLVDQSVPELPSTINTAANAVDTVNTVLGAINGYEISMIVNALEQQQGSDLLCSPKITVISGSTASITVSQQMRYPETWGDVQSNVGSSSSTGTGSAAGVTITPGTPQDFTTFDVGVVMEVTPSVEEDGSINLTLNPRVTEFEGFMEYGGVAVALSAGTTVTVPSGFIQPVFSIREVRTTVTVFDGATVVMGGLTREEVRSVNDSVPILADIPFIGRLFQSKGETRQKKNLLIFVTANRISPGGSVGREQFQEMRAGSVFQNPVIVSPGGPVQRVLEDEAVAK